MSKETCQPFHGSEITKSPETYEEEVSKIIKETLKNLSETVSQGCRFICGDVKHRVNDLTDFFEGKTGQLGLLLGEQKEDKRSDRKRRQEIADLFDRFFYEQAELAAEQSAAEVRNQPCFIDAYLHLDDRNDERRKLKSTRNEIGILTLKLTYQILESFGCLGTIIDQTRSAMKNQKKDEGIDLNESNTILGKLLFLSNLIKRKLETEEWMRNRLMTGEKISD